ncbi:MAG: CpaF family protein [Bdellovibrionales bacterium]|nr:CpaF family protein [Bdellovibrionales bacterium]
MTEIQIAYNKIVQHIGHNNNIDISSLPAADAHNDLQSQVKKLLSEQHSNLPNKAKERLTHEFFSAGPLETLIHDPEVTEIIVNGPETIWYEKRGELHEFDDHFFSPISFQNFLQRLTTESRIQVHLDRPFTDGYWRQYRVHVIIPPLAQGGAHLSLRRHPENPWSLTRLEDVGWASPKALKTIRDMIKNKMTFLIIGSTGTGKTSVLSACMQELKSTERVVIIEDTSEIHLPNKLSVKLLARQDSQGLLSNIDQCELLKQSLRMRPDRIVMGEVRGAEAKDLIMAFSTGHSGGMGTLHADNARQALYRLEMLIQMGAPQWSVQAIRHLIYFGVQGIITVKRVNGHRQLAAIHRITTLEETGFCLESLEI